MTKHSAIIGCLFLLAAIVSSCGTSEDTSQYAEPAMAEPLSLQARLDARRMAFDSAAPEDMKRIFKDGVLQVAESGVLETALSRGDVAPKFELPDATGKTVSLDELLEDGPVVLTWYRGGWCPYCNIQLQAYLEVYNQIVATGGQLVAVSPEIPDSSLSTSQKYEMAFPVLSDVGNRVAREYGIVYTLPESVANVFAGLLDLAAYNNDDSMQLPLAVTYVVDTDRTIAYAFVDADYKKRAEPAEIIDALKQLQDPK